MLHVGDKYWFVTETAEDFVACCEFFDDAWDKQKASVGNIYTTREAALEAVRNGEHLERVFRPCN